MAPKTHIHWEKAFFIYNNDRTFTDFYIDGDNGYTGIGTSSPISQLDVRAWDADQPGIISVGNSDRSHFLELFGGQSSNQNAYIKWKQGDPLRFATDSGGFFEAMWITSNGNVGIGTETPAYKLDVNGDIMVNGNNYLFVDSAGNEIEFSGSGNATYESYGAYIRATTNPTSGGSLFRVLSSGGAERFRVEHGGAVRVLDDFTVGNNITVGNNFTVTNNAAIGTTVTTEGNLSIVDNGNAVPGIYLSGYDSNEGDIAVDASDALQIGHWAPGSPGTFTSRIYVQADGDVGIGTTAPSYKLEVNGDINALGAVRSNSSTLTSDKRFKTNLTTLTSVLEKLDSVNAYYHKWDTVNFPERNFPNTTTIGLMAQDLMKVYPELVINDKEGFYGVDYQKFTAVLLQAIKEQQAIIVSLQQLLNKQQLDIQNIKVENNTLKQESNTFEVRLREIENELGIGKTENNHTKTKNYGK